LNEDLTRDGQVTIADVNVVRGNYLVALPPPPMGASSDVNADGITNDLDAYTIFQELLKPAGLRDLQYDLTGDGQVTTADLDVVKARYLQSGQGLGLFTAASDGTAVVVEAAPIAHEQTVASASAAVPDASAGLGHFADVSDVTTDPVTGQGKAGSSARLKDRTSVAVAAQPVHSSVSLIGAKRVDWMASGRESSLAWIFHGRRDLMRDLHRSHESLLVDETTGVILKWVARQPRLTAQPNERHKR